jgi:hypothetical protein
MSTANGITTLIKGSLGPLLYRRGKNGDQIVVPRARRDKKSSLQVEQRRRFRLLVSIASRLYLQHLKPFFLYSRHHYTAIDAFISLNNSPWYESSTVPYVRLFMLPTVRPPQLTVITINSPRSGKLTWWLPVRAPLLPSDILHIIVLQSPAGAVFWNGDGVALSAGEWVFPAYFCSGKKTVLFVHYVTRIVAGNVTLMSNSRSDYYSLW